MEQVDSQPSSVADDDEEDLEQLRLAALKSLKKPLVACSDKVPMQKPYFKNGVNRGRSNFHGRMHRNGQFNHRTRNTNLIAVPLISDDTEEMSTQPPPKLILPQDRYCKSNTSVEKTEQEQNSKFNRYNDKSDTESDSDDDNDAIGEEKEEKKLERSNSLEALMQELENEIEGKEKTANKVKVKKVKKKVEEKVIKVERVKIDVTEVEQKKEMLEKKQPVVVVPPPPQYVPPPVHYYQPPPVIPPYTVVPAMHYELPPPRYEPRIPSPLTIDTDLLNTTVTAPLSPRSAAFVLQNREIIERRKQRQLSSPSYSRSPTPSSPSPPPPPPPSSRYRGRSRTKSRSPTMKTPPTRRRNSVERKSSIHDRLGARTEQSSPKRKRSLSPDRKQQLDPVLEARKKKFESNELKIKEGVIRLKPPKEEENDEKPSEIIDDEPDDVIDVNVVDDLFSDESDTNENEGRFKTGKQTRKVPPTLPPPPPTTTTTNKENKERKKRTLKKPPISRLMVRADKQKTVVSPVSTLPEKKIEIKIRNPTKYEEKEKTKVRKVVEIGPHIESHDDDDGDDDVDLKEIVGSKIDDKDDVVVDLNEGDLRAQLSRKRAERQNKSKLPVGVGGGGEGVASRLLQSALKGAAVFKKVKSTSKTKNTTTSKDGKLPIHSRLGVLSMESATKKKRKRNKNRDSNNSGGLEQV